MDTESVYVKVQRIAGPVVANAMFEQRFEAGEVLAEGTSSATLRVYADRQTREQVVVKSWTKVRALYSAWMCMICSLWKPTARKPYSLATGCYGA